MWKKFAAATLGLGMAVSSVHATERPSVTFQIDAAHDGATKFKGKFDGPLSEIWHVDFTGRGDP